MNGSDFLVGLFTILVVLFIAYAAYPAALAIVSRLLKRWERRLLKRKDGRR